MRKHLVVVGVAASALLLAGGVAATSAGAEENPDIPGLPFAWPGLPGWSDFGYDPDADDINNTDNTDDYQNSGDDRDDDAGAGDTYDGSDDAGMSDQDAPPADDEEPAPAQRPAQAQRPAPAQAQAQRPAPARADAQRPGAARQQNRAQVQRDQAPRSAVNHAALARRPVTAADVSSSPNAPVQLRVLELINQNRERGGCDSVELDGRLIDAANEHASDMARRRFFAHESPNGDNAGERVREAGYRWKRYGENIARGADSPYEVVDGWMHSPSHRKNILDCSLHEMGIGLAIARGGTTYWVQDFATPQQ